MIPAEVVLEAEDALALLESAGNAAGALVMMNAHRINTDVNHHAGWESLDVPGFCEGAVELGRSLFSDFKRAISNEAAGLASIAAKIKGINEPVSVDPRRLNFSPVLAYYSSRNKSWDLEDAVCGLRNIVDLQSVMLCTHIGLQVEHTAPARFCDKLDAAFKSFHAAQNKMHTAFLCVAPSLGLMPKPAPATAHN